MPLRDESTSSSTKSDLWPECNGPAYFQYSFTWSKHRLLRAISLTLNPKLYHLLTVNLQSSYTVLQRKGRQWYLVVWGLLSSTTDSKAQSRARHCLEHLRFKGESHSSAPCTSGLVGQTDTDQEVWQHMNAGIRMWASFMKTEDRDDGEELKGLLRNGIIL